MPRLLPPDALRTPSTKPRWIALAALAALAAPFATGLAIDAAPASLTQQTTAFIWDAEALASGAEPARTDLAELLTGTETPLGAQVTGSAGDDSFTLTAAWEPGATITEIRLDHYRDHHGEGLRIGIAAHTATGTGEHCLALAATGLDTALGDTVLRTCVRTDAQTQNETYPGRGDPEPAAWEPGHLFITQTAELTPATTGEHLVDYFGLGADPGDPDETGLWGPHWWQPMDHRTEAHGWRRSCGDPEPAATIPAPPVEGMERPGLPIPACVPIHRGTGAAPHSSTASPPSRSPPTGPPRYRPGRATTTPPPSPRDSPSRPWPTCAPATPPSTAATPASAATGSRACSAPGRTSDTIVPVRSEPVHHHNGTPTAGEPLRHNTANEATGGTWRVTGLDH